MRTARNTAQAIALAAATLLTFGVVGCQSNDATTEPSTSVAATPGAQPNESPDPSADVHTLENTEWMDQLRQRGFEIEITTSNDTALYFIKCADITQVSVLRGVDGSYTDVTSEAIRTPVTSDQILHYENLAQCN